MHGLLSDLRYAIRNLTQARGFAAVATLALGCDLGATSRPKMYPENLSRAADIGWALSPQASQSQAYLGRLELL